MNNKYYNSIWYIEENKCCVKRFDISDSLKKYPVVVESIFSLISQGSEKIVFNGNIPSKISENMKIPYQINGFTYPFNYGYSLVGSVQDGPNHMLGKHIHLLHPHTSMAFVHANDCTLIPDGVSLESSIVDQMQTAITAIWDAKIVW